MLDSGVRSVSHKGRYDLRLGQTPRFNEHTMLYHGHGAEGCQTWFFVESLASMSSTGEMRRRLRIQFEGAIYHVIASASPSLLADEFQQIMARIEPETKNQV